MTWQGEGVDFDNYQKDMKSNRLDKYSMRHWMRSDETRNILIVDDLRTQSFKILDHILYNSITKKPIYRPCRGSMPCELCDKKVIAIPFVFLTVIDFTPYTNKSGKQYTHFKKLMAIGAKNDLPLFINKYKEHGGTKLTLWKVFRKPEGKSFGDDWTFVKRADEAKLKAKGVDYSVLDYEAMIKSVKDQDYRPLISAPGITWSTVDKSKPEKDAAQDLGMEDIEDHGTTNKPATATDQAKPNEDPF